MQLELPQPLQLQHAQRALPPPDPPTLIIIMNPQATSTRNQGSATTAQLVELFKCVPSLVKLIMTLLRLLHLSLSYLRRPLSADASHHQRLELQPRDLIHLRASPI